MFLIKKTLIFIALVLISSVYIKAKTDDIVIIPDQSLRFRVIANSNSLEDYKIKTEVKNTLEKELITLLTPANTLSETKTLIFENLDNIDEIVSSVLKSEEIDYNINFGDNYFPKKVYKGVVYEEGNYESLVITIGKGKGDNWWCVLFPPLCLLEIDDDTSDVEYQFYISRIIDYFK